MLDHDVSTLPGLGTRQGALIAKLAGPTYLDLLWHLPSHGLDRRRQATVSTAPVGEDVTLTVQIDTHHAAPTPKAPYRITCFDETGDVELVFFRAKGDWLERQMPAGTTRLVTGKVEDFRGKKSIVHPEVSEPGAFRYAVEPVYPLTGGLPARVLQKAVRTTLNAIPDLPEWLDPALMAREGWTGWADTLRAVHQPNEPTTLDLLSPQRRRLAYDELLADQLALGLIRERTRNETGRMTKGDGRLRRALVKNLPYKLTGDQRTAALEVAADMALPRKMLRLVQGDVGSGKTIVALLSLLNAVETGAQAALMAPTEILARQHAATIGKLAEPLGVSVALLTGRDKSKSRQRVLSGLADGSIQIAIGTHALFQDEVVYRDLALAVIDEQHRFGVEQRVKLGAKGRGVDILVMTATPIPRSLTLTQYGDLDVSYLREKPAGRQKIETRLVSLARLEDVYRAVGRKLATREKIYWVCPLIDESETSDLAAVGDRFAELSRRYPGKVCLVHGKMKPTERDAVMMEFVRGQYDLLVATTVIEVGVDVPAATTMIIEHADRFGLAQLHQLRGRVGRGDKPSACLLLFSTDLGDAGEARIKTMRDTDDGFRIAEEDLKLRGAGQMLGTKQSGDHGWRLADPAAHQDLLELAHNDAKYLTSINPKLSGDRGEALRTLLYLFARDEVVRWLRSG